MHPGGAGRARVLLRRLLRDVQPRRARRCTTRRSSPPTTSAWYWHTLEFPALATTECTDAFALYACLAGFPRCEEDADNPGVYVELPLCFDYCVNAHMSCSGDAILSQAACDKAVVVGRVAPPRPDITCVSRAERARGGGGGCLFLGGGRAQGIAAGALLVAATNEILLAAPGRGGA